MKIQKRMNPNFVFVGDNLETTEHSCKTILTLATLFMFLVRVNSIEAQEFTSINIYSAFGKIGFFFSSMNGF